MSKLTSLQSQAEALLADIRAAQSASATSPRAAAARAATAAAAAVSRGMPEGDALALAAEAAGVSILQAKAAYDHHDKGRRALDLFGRRYAAYMMSKAGLSADRIAAELGCHPKHVRRLAKEMAAWFAHTAK